MWLLFVYLPGKTSAGAGDQLDAESASGKEKEEIGGPYI